MGKRRESRYSRRVNIGLESATASRVREASNRYDVAEAVILRRAIDVGLDRAIDAIRKQTATRAARGTE